MISNSLVEKIRSFDREDSLRDEINREVYKIVMDSVLEDDHLFLILNPMFIDLDSDGNSELVSLFGEFQQGCHLGIFTKQEDGWKCIFFEEFHHHYEGVNFSIVNSGAKEKLIVIKDLELRGSGVYKEVAHFFKLIDGEIIHCLRLLTDSRIHGWGLYLNQELKTRYDFSTYYGRDELEVVFAFSYFPGAIFEGDAPWDSHQEIVLIEKNEQVSFTWDNESKKYEPEYKKEHEYYGLSEKQYLALDEFGNDTLIIEAFRGELEKILGEKDERKAIVKRYFEMVEKDKKATVPSGGIEKFGETKGGLKFYGINVKNNK
jgi:hypothetical protein